MRITTEQLQQHLARELKALYTVFGDETLLGLEASDRIRARARAAGYSERQGPPSRRSSCRESIGARRRRAGSTRSSAPALSSKRNRSRARRCRNGSPGGCARRATERARRPWGSSPSASRGPASGG